MLKQGRHERIVTVLHQQGRVQVADLVARLDVSEDTVRRDLGELAAMGVLQRVHGGAILRPLTAPFAERLLDESGAKGAIAAVAARLARDGQLLLLDSGTTVLAIARRFPVDLKATVFTTSVPVAAALSNHPSVEVHMIGGRLLKAAQATVGVPAVESIKRVRADLCFLGICSLDIELGITVSDPDEAEVKRVMVAQAAEVVAAAESDKLNTAGPYLVDPITAITYLVTDESVAGDLLAPYQAQGIQVLQG
ncbi:MAG TPA: DeoR/GlpR family DNA-binding transcription regulator [Chloroflexota bacterium]